MGHQLLMPVAKQGRGRVSRQALSCRVSYMSALQVHQARPFASVRRVWPFGLLLHLFLLCCCIVSVFSLIEGEADFAVLTHTVADLEFMT